MVVKFDFPVEWETRRRRGNKEGQDERRGRSGGQNKRELERMHDERRATSVWLFRS